MGTDPPAGSPIDGHDHAVHFYGDDAALSNAIAGFLIKGLVAQQPTVIIATPAHTRDILDHLIDRHIGVARARQVGDLAVLDADETLSRFMADGMPEPALFCKAMGDVLEQASRGRERTPVRAYGEMVDVLWKKGAPHAAIRLEVLWNELAATHAFSLLCGYAIGNFYKQASRLDEVVQQHTHVIGVSSNDASIEAARTAYDK